MSKIISEIEKEQLKQDLPEFGSGDTVVVKISVTEGTRTRLQSFEGVVIAKKNRGLNSSFTVRKISYGEGVERTFQTHSPQIAEIDVRRRGDVRQAKIYYLRERSGKSARIKEKLDNRSKTEKAADKKDAKAKKVQEKKAEAVVAKQKAADNSAKPTDESEMGKSAVPNNGMEKNTTDAVVKKDAKPKVEKTAAKKVEEPPKKQDPKKDEDK